MAAVYICQKCGDEDTFEKPPKECPSCGDAAMKISYKPPYRKMVVAQPKKKRKREDLDNSRPGRCKSAPSQTAVGDLEDDATLDPSVTIVDNFKGAAWTNGHKKIRLAYRKLSPDSDDCRGLVINPGVLIEGEAQKHFEHIAKVMRAGTISDRQATEATGEAAAALGMLKSTTHPGFKMLTGFHVHSGTGIDQIWGKPKQGKGATGYDEYMIVEAKGVNATPRVDNFAEECGTQMSENWVVDRLGRMQSSQDKQSKKVANEMVDALGLNLTQKSSKNISKKYWMRSGGLKKKRPTVGGIVFEAKWNKTKLSYIPSGKTQYFTK